MFQAASVLMRDAGILSVMLFWGSTFLFTKMGLEGFSPLVFAVMRTAFAAAALNLLAVRALTRAAHGHLKLSFKEHLMAALLGFLGMTCFPFCFTLAMQWTTAAEAGLIFGATPVAVGLISALTGQERLDGRMWTGLALSFIGILFILAPQRAGLELSTGRGELLMLAAMFLWAVYTVGNRLVSEGRSQLHMTAYSSLWGVTGLAALSLGPLAAADWGSVGPQSWAGAACAGILSTALAYVIWNSHVRRIGPSKTAVYMNLVPLVAALTGFAILGEPLGWNHAIGGAVIMAGVILTRMRRPRRPVLLHPGKRFGH